MNSRGARCLWKKLSNFTKIVAGTTLLKERRCFGRANIGPSFQLHVRRLCNAPKRVPYKIHEWVLLVFKLRRNFRLILESKARAQLKNIRFGLKGVSGDKHSSLFAPFVTYDVKSQNIGLTLSLSMLLYHLATSPLAKTNCRFLWCLVVV